VSDLHDHLHKGSSLQSDLLKFLLSTNELLFSCVCLSCSPQAPQPQAPEIPWADEENVVYHLTDEDFDKFIKDHSSVLVMFHAPCEFAFSILYSDPSACKQNQW